MIVKSKVTNDYEAGVTADAIRADSQCSGDSAEGGVGRCVR